MPSGPGIFVRMAAYRDAECAWTVADAFDSADDPDRVWFGICWQYQPGVDRTVPAFDSERASQVRFTRVAAQASLGVCWARYQAERLWRGEAYTLQVDSHSRFAPGWDSALIAELGRCPSPKPILSTNPARYAPPSELELNPTPLIRCARPFGTEGELRFEARYPDAPLAEPRRSAFIAGGFLFSRAEVLREVPYDPHSYFNHEEAAYALRLFSHGWDVFVPSIVTIYHYYNPSGSRESSVRPLHWHENTDWGHMNYRARLRFDHLTGYRQTREPNVLTELGQFGLGAARSLGCYEAFAGVDFRSKQISDRAARGEVDVDALAAPQLGSVTAPAGEVPPVVAAAPAEAANQTSEQTSKQTNATLEAPALREGAFVPPFTVMDDTGQTRRLHDYGGEQTALFVLPDAEPGYYRRFFATRDRYARALAGLEQVFVLPLPEPRLRGLRKRLGLPHTLWCDAAMEVSRLFGAAGGTRGRNGLAVSCLLSPSLQIVRLYRSGAADEQLEALARDAPALARPPRLEPVGAHAPVLQIPNVLASGECERLLAYYETGHRFAGTVGAGARARYDERNKIRTDCEIKGELLRELDRTFALTMFPEVKKVFGFEVSHREAYKIGCYAAQKGGFFYRHRDNADPELAYRHCAVSVNLNDDYQGGEIQFPEYGGALYRPARGAALVFPCSLMHKVLQMKSGNRYALISFLFGEEDARRWTAQAGAERGREMDGRRALG
jgi:predicted 2-oxoglutarate/Fe(II)-dependent dioxygenase YbiX/peroxiredoxin